MAFPPFLSSKNFWSGWHWSCFCRLKINPNQHPSDWYCTYKTKLYQVIITKFHPYPLLKTQPINRPGPWILCVCVSWYLRTCHWCKLSYYSQCWLQSFAQLDSSATTMQSTTHISPSTNSIIFRNGCSNSPMTSGIITWSYRPEPGHTLPIFPCWCSLSFIQRTCSKNKYKHICTLGFQRTIKTMVVKITTIDYLRVLIIEIGSTIILKVVEAQGAYSSVSLSIQPLYCDPYIGLKHLHTKSNTFTHTHFRNKICANN